MEYAAAMQAAKDEAQAEIEKHSGDTNHLNTELKTRLDRLTQEREVSCLGRRIYHEAPDDVFELIVTNLSHVHAHWYLLNRKGMGGMNVLRMVSKRLKQVVESCATMLTNTHGENGPYSLPLDILGRCKRIQHIRCDSQNLRSLDGCPNGLKGLHVRQGNQMHSLEPLRICTELETLAIFGAPVSDLSPLAECTRMTHLCLMSSRVTDISPLSSMHLLEYLAITKIPGQPPIKDWSPLLQCKRIENLTTDGNKEFKDLSLFQNHLRLTCLVISDTRVEDLTPLTVLPDFKFLDCIFIPTTTSLLPLDQSKSLRTIMCDRNAKDLDKLQQRMPDVKFQICEI